MLVHCRILLVLLFLGSTLVGTAAIGRQDPPPPRKPDRSSIIEIPRTRGGSIEKLAPDLRILYRQYQVTRGERPDGYVYDEAKLKSIFGITSDSSNPWVEVAIELVPGTENTVIEQAGAAVRFRRGSVAYCSTPVLALERLAQLGSVVSIGSMPIPRIPELPEPKEVPSVGLPPRGGESTALKETVFDSQGYTGNGVIIGVMDSGIDWRHPAFIKADGTTRILYLYDPFDDSYTTSKGKIGSEPPLVDPQSKKPIGTLYTAAHINAALKGKGTVNSKDTHGHGTACAGTAAGRAGPSGYGGIAPEADLIIVKRSETKLEGQYPRTTYSKYTYDMAEWIFERAKAMGRPCVLSGSFGGHSGPKDGSTPVEQRIDGLIGPGVTGLAAAFAAGNDKEYSFYAGGKFGPDRPGQVDVESPPIELFVKEPTWLDCYFDLKDEWGLVITGLDNFFLTPDGNPAHFIVFKEGAEVKLAYAYSVGKPTEEEKQRMAIWYKEFVETWAGSTRYGLYVKLPPGKYLVRGFGASDRVSSGRFDFYLPLVRGASFGRGAIKRYMVDTPGNAANAITVGAYNFRGTWVNMEGKETAYNLELGDVSTYSSPGFRLDGLVKPDITAPATYTISALSRDSLEMGVMYQRNASGALVRVPHAAHVAHGGDYLAWSGTSASTPYVAGVVALMLQKNPTLDAKQIKDIIIKTARSDKFTDAVGGLPNPEWGYGKIDPAAALRATPAATKPSLKK